MSRPEAPEFLTLARRNLKEAVKRYLAPDSYVMRKQYFQRHGFYPDLQNPKDLSEKTLWLKLHDRSALHSLCADKIRARGYVASQLGPEVIIPEILVSYDAADINPETITAERFVIKTNHDQGGIFICRDRASFDWDEARRKIAKRLTINKYYEFREHQYKSIRPGILVEDYVTGDRGSVCEFKFYCFHGEPKFVQVVPDRFGDRRETFYDMDWRRMHFSGPAPLIEHDLPRPPGFEALQRDAAILSEPFLFCRIDFLVGTVDRPWFGEITFHHGAGLIRFQPKEFERAFGDMIDLSRLEETRRRREALARDARAEGRWDASRAAPRAG
jgi:hypothetical protein